MNVATTKAAGVLVAAIALALLPRLGAAQEVDHSMHMPAPAEQQEKKAVPKKAAAKPAAKPAATDPHAGHGAAQAPAAEATSEIDHAAMGHGTSAVPIEPPPVDHSTTDHSAMGHDQAAPDQPDQVDHSTMDHSTMDHSAMGHEDRPAAPSEPLTPIPRLTDADRAAAVPPPHDHPVHDNTIQHYVLFNRLEAWDADPGTGMEWEGQGWIGTDLDRVWLRSEGERVDGESESASLEVLYGRSVSPWWDVVAGLRHDFEPGASQDFLALGVIGLAPYMFEVEATAYVGESGRSAARFEVEYEALLTNRLILQPLVEANLFGQNDEGRGIGSGLSTVEAGLRLRYEFTRQFAPYIGVVRERAFGRTADFRREEGEDIDDTRIVAGLRIWF